MDMSQYLEIFIDESNDHLQNLNEHLLELEKNPNNMKILDEVFRVAHTLKGMAGTMGFTRMQTLTHDMENVLSEIRSGKLKPNAKLLDVLFKCLDALESYVESIVNTSSEGEKEYPHIVSALNELLEEKSDSSTNQEAKEEIKEVKATEKVKLDNIDVLALKEAKTADMNIFNIEVIIDEKAVLKSARAFLVFKALEEIGEVVKSNPSAEDIEDEKFEFSFEIAFITKSSSEEIKKIITGISEIKDAIVEDINVDVINEEKAIEKQEQPKEIVSVEVKEEKIVTKQDDEQSEDKGDKSKAVSSKTVRVDIDRLDTLMNLVSELIIIKTRLEGINGVGKNNSNYNEAIEYLERITTSLHDAVMKVRMVPVERVFNRFPRLMRDLSRKLEKDFELYMSGEETELDRTVIDEIGDPLIHLLRNAADHGIETPEIREQSGKSKSGSVFLRAYQDGNSVVIEVEDDGAGINVEKIREKAIERGIISHETAMTMSEQDIKELLFKAGFSMAKEITDISGRGVGLDVVKNKIEALGGIIELRSTEGKGSKFIIRLPLTLAIIQSLMVKLGKEQYAIPLNTIETIEDIKLTDIKYVQKQEVILLRDRVIPIIHLDDVLNITRDEERGEVVTVVIVKKGEKEAGFVVDSLIGQQEIVIKSLGTYLSGIKMIAGATILGDGEVALILDVNTLVK